MSNQFRFAAVGAAIVALTLLMGAPPAAAVGSGDSNPPSSGKTSSKCKKGKIWDSAINKCVPARRSSLDDDQKYEAVRELAHAKRYQSALIVLSAMSDQSESRVLTYRGFIARMQGNADAALRYYEAALSTDPDNLLARSYLGMWFAEQGELEKARRQLAEIRRRGGTGTWPDRALKKTIAGQMGYAT